MRSMTTSLTRWRSLGRCAVIALLATLPWLAAAQAPAAEPAPLVFSQEQLDPLLAPVALYPDTLLTQVLIAATYPLEVVEAERFIRANPKLKGSALTRAANGKTWDASVVSLPQFPSVITMMNDQLDWTQQLGDAFLSQQGDAMDTVQSLRARAQQAGNLHSSAQQKVVVQEKIIVIESLLVQTVHVPYCELSAISVLDAYVQAQREYVLRDRNSNGLLKYAQRIVSSEGRQDGLYWPTSASEPASPMGSRFALASLGRYQGTDEAPQPFDGYFFRPLTGQGPAAAGGAYAYLVKGRQTGGFASIAAPARHGVAGVMTFIVNHDAGWKREPPP